MIQNMYLIEIPFTTRVTLSKVEQKVLKVTTRIFLCKNPVFAYIFLGIICTVKFREFIDRYLIN